MKTLLPGYAEALERVREVLIHENDYRPLLLGVDGSCGVGKSHFGSWLSWQLGIPVVALDLFLIQDSEPLTWRLDDLRRVIDSRLNDVNPRPVIVEGILLLDALSEISRTPDFLFFVNGQAEFLTAGNRLTDYLTRTKSINANFYLEEYRDSSEISVLY